MRWGVSLCGVVMATCASAGSQPPPSLSPVKVGVGQGPEPEIESLELPPAEALPVNRVSGELVQGGLSFWKTLPGSEVFLDGAPVPIDAEGHFAIGFGRDHGPEAELLVELPDGSEERWPLTIGDREFPESRIEGIADNLVNPYTKEDLTKIRNDQKLKAQARSKRTRTSYWRAGFDWPLYGRISGVFGSQRFYNGEGRRPHSGTDIARRPGMTAEEFIGTDVRAPSAGIVTLAEPDMFFEGGLILIDHGQEMESAMLHLSRIDVKAGDVVSKGQVIGGVGATGRATGPHLHWTVNWRGQPMDAQLIVGDISEARRR